MKSQECKHGISSFSSRGCWNCIVEDNDRLHSDLEAVMKVVRAAKAFRDRGEAKNGTHGSFLFAALDALAAYEAAK